MSTSPELLAFLSRVYLDRHRGVWWGWVAGRGFTLMQPYYGGWKEGGAAQSNRHSGNNSSQICLIDSQTFRLLIVL